MFDVIVNVRFSKAQIALLKKAIKQEGFEISVSDFVRGSAIKELRRRGLLTGQPIVK